VSKVTTSASRPSSANSTCAEASVAWPQSGTSSAGVNQRRPKRAGSAVFSRKAVSAWLFSAASACIQAASGQASIGSSTQAGLPRNGPLAKASTVHWRIRPLPQV